MAQRYKQLLKHLRRRRRTNLITPTSTVLKYILRNVCYVYIIIRDPKPSQSFEENIMNAALHIGAIRYLNEDAPKHWLN